MSLIQPLQYGASEADWNAWMLALTQWAQNQDDISAGLPVTKQGVDNLMQMSGSTSNAFLMYFVESLPPQPSFPTQVVYNGEDGRIYAWSTVKNAWEPTGATAFDQLTGFLQAGQILIGNQINICTNGCFTYDTVGQTPSGWAPTSSYSNAPVIVQQAASSPPGCPTANCIYIQGRDTYFSAGNGFDVKPGENYYLESYMGSDGTTPGMNFGLYFPAVGANGPAWEVANGAARAFSGWGSANGVVVVPSWANRAQVWLQVNATGNSPGSYGNNWFTGVECVKAPSNIQTYTYQSTSVVNDNGVHTIFSGNFTTGYASIVHASTNWDQTTGTISMEVDLVIDGVTVDHAPLILTSTGNQQVALSLLGIVASAGTHSFSIQVRNGGSASGSIQITSMVILNLLK